MSYLKVAQTVAPYVMPALIKEAISGAKNNFSWKGKVEHHHEDGQKTVEEATIKSKGGKHEVERQGHTGQECPNPSRP